MFEDSRVRFVPRAIEAEWSYARILPVTMSGFNPWSGAVYYAERSRLAEWLGSPQSDARRMNEGDHLVHEHLFALHDYFHVWAYQVIHCVLPKLRIGSTPITGANIEDFVFCHLLTETVATVAVDYWFLSTLEIDEVLEIGTAKSMLATPYREKDKQEYRRFNRSFEPQRVEFFSEMARFYCSGNYRGFDLSALRKSAKLHRWMEHELSYGETQRSYTRTWLASLAVESISIPKELLEAEVEIDRPWKRELIAILGALLWEEVKNGRPTSDRKVISHESIWTPDRGRAWDFRFVNWNRLGASGRKAVLRAGEIGPDSLKYLQFQILGRCAFDTFDPDLFPLIEAALALPSVLPLASLCGRFPQLKPGRAEPLSMFFPN